MLQLWSGEKETNNYNYNIYIYMQLQSTLHLVFVVLCLQKRSNLASIKIANSDNFTNVGVV